MVEIKSLKLKQNRIQMRSQNIWVCAVPLVLVGMALAQANGAQAQQLVLKTGESSGLLRFESGWSVFDDPILIDPSFENPQSSLERESEWDNDEELGVSPYVSVVTNHKPWVLTTSEPALSKSRDSLLPRANRQETLLFPRAASLESGDFDIEESERGSWANQEILPDILKENQSRFRNLVQSAIPSSALEERYLGTLTQSTALAIQSDFPGAGFSKSGELAEVLIPANGITPNGIFTVKDGKFYEVKRDKFDASVGNQKKVEIPKGFVVSLHQESSQSEGRIELEKKEASRAELIEKKSGFLASVYQVNTSYKSIGKGILRGKVNVPSDVDPSSVVVGVVGTEFRVNPNQDGYFELVGVPFDSRIQVALWDEQNILSRTVVHAEVGELESFLKVSLKKQSDLISLSQAFGAPHNITQSGFCGKVTSVGDAKHIQIKATDLNQKPIRVGYFSDSGLPDLAKKSLGIQKNFCIFNVNSPYVNLSAINTQTGERRVFVLPQHHSTFEFDLAFDMTSMIYRPLQILDLYDSQQVIGLASGGESNQMDFAEANYRSWMDGQDIANWVGTSDAFVQTDPAYAFAPVNQRSSLTYFPYMGPHRFTAVEAKTDVEDGPKSFSVVGSNQLLTSQILKRESDVDGTWMDSKSPLNLPILGVQNLGFDIDRLFSTEMVLPNAGSLFLQLDLAKLGLDDDYLVEIVGLDGLKLQEVKSEKIMSMDGSKSRIKREFLFNIPLGDYSLLVKDKNGVVKNYQLVRSLPNAVQTLVL